MIISKMMMIIIMTVMMMVIMMTIIVKITSHVHNYEHEQIPMVTDLHRRPVMGFLYLGVEAGGVYRWAIGQRLGTPLLQQGELPSCSGAGIYAAVQVDPL